MPELPEVETIARTLEPQIKGRVIDAVHIVFPKTFEAGHALLPSLFPGAVITGVSRRGKLLLLFLDTDYVLAFHLKMTGRLFVYPAGTEPNKHTRLVFDLAAKGEMRAARLFFDDSRKFGYCRLMRRDELAAWPFWQKLGPEPFSLAPEVFADRLAKRSSPVKALLLDQHVVAGVGNIYADESCFLSGIHPAARASSLGRERLALLLEKLQEVLAESIKQCGTSVRDYRDANGNAGAFQNLLRVYGRAGQACLFCGSVLGKTTVAGRTTVFCPGCQKE